MSSKVCLLDRYIYFKILHNWKCVNVTGSDIYYYCCCYWAKHIDKHLNLSEFFIYTWTRCPTYLNNLCYQKYVYLIHIWQLWTTLSVWMSLAGTWQMKQMKLTHISKEKKRHGTIKTLFFFFCFSSTAVCWSLPAIYNWSSHCLDSPFMFSSLGRISRAPLCGHAEAFLHRLSRLTWRYMEVWPWGVELHWYWPVRAISS